MSINHKYQIFCFEKIKMDYINYDIGDPSVQGVSEGPTRKKQLVTKYIYKTRSVDTHTR